MADLFQELGLAVVCVTALGRVAGILFSKIRQSRYAKRAVALPSSWRDRCTIPEPYILAATTLVLALGHDPTSPPSSLALASVGAGALLGLAGIALMLWAVNSFPTVSTGHYVLPDHRVVSDGPYRWVRHPLYLAAFLIWLGVALCFRSGTALAIIAFYVVPAYLIYMRSEEEMLLAHLGDAYRSYRRETGMLFPRPARRR